ncbi:MAG: DNA recombination protein RmuC [Clostridiaceae bacterium]
MEPLLYAIAVLLCAALALLIALLVKQKNGGDTLGGVERIRREMGEQQSALRMELSETTQRAVRNMGEAVAENQKRADEAQTLKLAELDRHLMTKQELLLQAQQKSALQTEERFKTFALENEQKLEQIRSTVEKKLAYMQTDNNEKLDQIKQIVDEKLQKTLEERMTQSFMLVNERLEQVHKGLGEMQSLAVGVGDLKKVLQNVKTRGIVGEIQLGAILQEILAPEQYESNAAVREDSRNVVEYAIKLPADDGKHIYLPVDSKFPAEPYVALMDAYDSGSPETIKRAQEALRGRVVSFARDIRDKYIYPPETTDFAIMFLPTEGLYAEAVKLGLTEQLQREFRVNLAGPSTMAVMLNSLQLAFRSVAIQKRSGEVWKVLGAVKTEFDKFYEALTLTQKRITSANEELDRLVGTRTRMIRSKLRDVTALPTDEAKQYLPEGQDAPASDEEE